MKTIDSSFTQSINLAFDKNLHRYTNIKSKKPLFRNTPDNDIGLISISFKLNNNINPNIRFYLGENYYEQNLHGFKITNNPNEKGDLNLKIYTPLKLLSFNQIPDGLGNFISFTLKTEDGKTIILKNSSGSINSPAGYSRLIFIPDGEYFGFINSGNLSKLIEKLEENSIINR